MDAFQRAIETRDVEAAGEVLDPDYALCLVHPTAMVIPRDQWLAMLPNYVVHEWTVQEQQIDIDGDCALVFHRGLQRATVVGEPRDGIFVVSDIWRRREDGWRVWRRDSSPLAPLEMPAR